MGKQVISFAKGWADLVKVIGGILYRGSLFSTSSCGAPPEFQCDCAVTGPCLALSSLLFKAVVVHLPRQSYTNIYNNLEVSTRRNGTGKKRRIGLRRKNLLSLKGFSNKSSTRSGPWVANIQTNIVPPFHFPFQNG